MLKYLHNFNVWNLKHTEDSKIHWTNEMHNIYLKKNKEEKVKCKFSTKSTNGRSTATVTFEPERAIVPRFAISSSWFMPTPVSCELNRESQCLKWEVIPTCCIKFIHQRAVTLTSRPGITSYWALFHCRNLPPLTTQSYGTSHNLLLPCVITVLQSRMFLI